VGACCNSVTICLNMNITTCPDNVTLTKHAIAKNRTSNHV